jgi:hypothetical protein
VVVGQGVVVGTASCDNDHGSIVQNSFTAEKFPDKFVSLSYCLISLKSCIQIFI